MIEFRAEARGLSVILKGRLDSDSVGSAWSLAIDTVAERRPATLIVEAEHLDYCDGAGAALLLHLKAQQSERNAQFSIVGANQHITSLIALYDNDQVSASGGPPSRFGLVEWTGKTVLAGLDEIVKLRHFYELCLKATIALASPSRRMRWRDVVNIAASVGVDAVPLITMLGFLIGLIMGFQSALPMRKFGADLFVANILGLSITRELGPLMTAVILAGRSGSAFAAELGTMKINEEIDALTTMAIDPVQFLVVPRMLAATLMMPLLAAYMILASLIGGGFVMAGIGIPPIGYVHQLMVAVHLKDFIGGLFKALVFGMLISSIGCARGLNTGTGASGVGTATTSAVVSGIVLIIIADGIFSIAFFYFGL